MSWVYMHLIEKVPTEKLAKFQYYRLTFPKNINSKSTLIHHFRKYLLSHRLILCYIPDWNLNIVKEASGVPLNTDW